MQKARARVGIVLHPGTESADVLGVVTKEHLAEALSEGMELFGD
jgi:hypothetical protein